MRVGGDKTRGTMYGDGDNDIMVMVVWGPLEDKPTHTFHQSYSIVVTNNAVPPSLPSLLNNEKKIKIYFHHIRSRAER